MHKEITLTQGHFSIVDKEDYGWLITTKWHYNNGYACRRGIKGEEPKNVLMHRLIMRTPDDMHTDHINGNTLDNRRNNLRICTQAENVKNRKKTKGSSIYKGVYFNKQTKHWHANIKINNKTVYVGFFKSEIDAAKSYNKAAIKYYGKFARINDLHAIMDYIYKVQ